MTKLNQRNIWIILLFSIAHGLCCLCCRTLGIEDARALTLLTIAMAFVLAYLRGLKVYFIIAAIIIINVLAYLIGNALPMVFRKFMGDTMWINVVSTTVTTLILGIMFEFSADMVLKMNRGDGFFKEVQNKKPFRQIWVVRINDRIVPVKTEQIAYFFSEDKCNHLVTFDGGKFIVDATMDAIMEDLDPKKFFRINRGCIVSLASIDSAIVNSGRYAVEVHPSIGITMTIARSRVDEFIKWLG